jgi:signal transduction histidine kinase
VSAELPDFDRDISLAELLRAVPRARLEAALTGTMGDVWSLVDGEGTTLMDSGVGTSSALIAFPLRVDIEAIGRVLAPEGRREQAQAAVAWLEMVLKSAHRYRMAADLHFEAVHADYEALQKKHAALQESEARYRELAAQLEQRVKAQVEVIEHTHRQLYQNEKMAAIGSLAAGMAHEINNPIGFIRSNLATASLYVGKLGKTLAAFRRGDAAAAGEAWKKLDIDFILEDFPGMLAESVSGADRVSRIVANLKAYSSIDCADAAAVDLNDAVRAAVGIVGDQLPTNVKLETELQPLTHVVCDLSRINQVLFSLLQNARQALGNGGGTIRVSSRHADDEIRIAVSDNGCGIAPDILDRIFDPFFTTREIGKGMGLGLTVSRDIVSAHGGRIDVTTAVGAGSTFTVCLPLPGAREGAALTGTPS